METPDRNLLMYKDYIKNACSYGQLDSLSNFLKEYKTHFKYQNIHSYTMTKGFEHAIYNGHLNIVEYLLTSSDLKKHADIHHNNDYAIRLSCFGGHLETVQFLLTSPLLIEKADVLANNSEAFRWAAESNHISVVQFLIDNNFQIDPFYISPVNGNSAFMSACDQNAIDAVTYLSNLPRFNLQSSLCSINKDGKDGFQLACENHEFDSEIVEYLVLALDFQPNERQKEYIKDNIDHPVVDFVNKLLNSKNLHDKLDNNFDSRLLNTPKIKI